MFDKNINFNSESAKKPKIYELLLLTPTFSPKYENNHPSEEIN